MYDITNQESFENSKHWLQEIETLAKPEVVVMLVGNKCDEEYHRMVPTARGRSFAGTEARSYCIPHLVILSCEFICKTPNLKRN